MNLFLLLHHGTKLFKRKRPITLNVLTEAARTFFGTLFSKITGIARTGAAGASNHSGAVEELDCCGKVKTTVGGIGTRRLKD